MSFDAFPWDLGNFVTLRPWKNCKLTKSTVVQSTKEEIWSNSSVIFKRNFRHLILKKSSWKRDIFLPPSFRHHFLWVEIKFWSYGKCEMRLQLTITEKVAISFTCFWGEAFKKSVNFSHQRKIFSRNDLTFSCINLQLWNYMKITPNYNHFDNAGAKIEQTFLFASFFMTISWPI